METILTQAIMTSIEALKQVPGTELLHIEATLRQLKADLQNLNITIPQTLEELVEDAAVAHAEYMAYGDWYEPYEPER
jgi:hypothetical protein